jgi:surface antigen
LDLDLSDISLRKLAIVAAIGVTLAGCSREPTGREVGSIIGATAGIFLGSQIGSGVGRAAATIGLASVGSWLGGELGEYLSREDQIIAQAATQEALENNEPGQTTSWSNPDTGISGKVTPGPTYAENVGTTSEKQCRNIKVAISPEGKEPRQANRIACRKANGDWEVLDA